MSKNLEYAIMIFLAGFLVILFLWSENGRYLIYGGDRGEKYLLNTMNGNAWYLNGDEMLYVLEVVQFSSIDNKTSSGLLDPSVFAKEDIKKDIRKKRMGIK